MASINGNMAILKFESSADFQAYWCEWWADFRANNKSKLIVAGVLRINIWFYIPVPKIKFDPPPQGKKYFGVHTLSPSLNQQIFPDVEISSKYWILLVLLPKL